MSALLPTPQEAAEIANALAETFTERCTILERRADSDGQGGIIPIWGVVADCACRTVPVRQTVQSTDGTVYGPRGDLDMLLPLNTQITDENRVMVNGRTWAVLTVLLRSSHIRVSLGGNLDGD